jgi:hypothetical protein
MNIIIIRSNSIAKSAILWLEEEDSSTEPAFDWLDKFRASFHIDHIVS